jgi:hypothetical protein
MITNKKEFLQYLFEHDSCRGISCIGDEYAQGKKSINPGGICPYCAVKNLRMRGGNFSLINTGCNLAGDNLEEEKAIIKKDLDELIQAEEKLMYLMEKLHDL